MLRKPASGALDQIATQNGVHRGRALEQPAHPAHAFKERLRKAAVAQ